MYCEFLNGTVIVRIDIVHAAGNGIIEIVVVYHQRVAYNFHNDVAIRIVRLHAHGCIGNVHFVAHILYYGVMLPIAVGYNLLGSFVRRIRFAVVINYFIIEIVTV